MSRRSAACLALAVLTGCRSPGVHTGETEDTRPHTDTPTDSADSGDSGDTSRPVGPTNVVVVLADDQPYNMMWAMPELTARVLPDAVSFEKAYVTVPLCCPMRASLLSGGWYPKDTGMLTNGEPMGGASKFVDGDTLATRLQEAGIATGMVGKYFNDYEYGMAPYVAPGWDTWVASGVGDGGYEQAVVIGSSGPDASTTGSFYDLPGDEHLTTWFFEQALDFVDAHAGEPFFLYIAPNSPHLSGSPAEEDQALYTDYEYRPESWNEEDVSDKPSWLQDEPLIGEGDAANIDTNLRTMLQNLASLDRETAAFVEALDARGVLDDTLFVYTSDNGYLFGEHRLTLKGLPYEESVHVPLVVMAPGVEGRTDPRLVAVNLDLAATITEAFGLPATGEGVPLGDAIADTGVEIRDHVYMDNFTTGFPVWAGVVTDRYKYIEWATGDIEIYDLAEDPSEMGSLHAEPPPAIDLAEYGSWVDEHRALAVLTEEIDAGQVGEPYSVQLEHWGGTAPVIYSLEGTLPDGLTLGGGGLLRGTPTEAGVFTFAVWARDASVSAWTGQAQAYNRALRLTIEEAPARATAPRSAAAAPEVTRTSETSATVTLRARPGVRVQVRATPEPVPEGARHSSEVVVAPKDGVVTLTIDGLRPDRTWYWVAYHDGIPAEHGRIPAAERK